MTPHQFSVPSVTYLGGAHTDRPEAAAAPALAPPKTAETPARRGRLSRRLPRARAGSRAARSGS